MTGRDMLKHEIIRLFNADACIDETVEDAASQLIRRAGNNGRIHSEDLLRVWKATLGAEYASEGSDEPADGWLMHTYLYLRNILFPHLDAPEDASRFTEGRESLLRFMHGAYEYERKRCPFDPTRDMLLLRDREITDNSFTREYLKMKRLIRENYVYEFMRIGAEITPFNTLGHISGVHYIAMYAARQLHAAGAPVDLGLISAAAATHDIGKYGCRKHEERRVPYLHYYYTDYCLGRFGLKQIAHIAANHSAWDLELDNLSVESLLLIYADFRCKSTREDGREIIHFYSLKEAFDVILSKLDNVDEAKRQRYIRVYNKLKDFEEYMIERGVHTEIEDCAAGYPRECEEPVVPVRRETVMLPEEEVIRQISFKAIDHNIRVMSRFSDDRQFGSLLEAARSETDWKNVRTYIEILREYSTYMTDTQKGMTLRFLYEMLSHHESDIRRQTAETMGYIVARYRKEYKKELPADIPAQDDDVSNISMFSQYIGLLLDPDLKYTDVHRRWITASTDFFVNSVLENCRESCRYRYLNILSGYYDPDYYLSKGCDDEKYSVLLIAAMSIDPEQRTAEFTDQITAFANAMFERPCLSTKLLALDVRNSYGVISRSEYETDRRNLLGLGAGSELGDDQMSSLFLDDLKAHVSWNIKAANVSIMKQAALNTAGQGARMQIATHLANLIKVSETVTVRRTAGEALLDIVPLMSTDQKNELVIELFNGLEIEDYQFSGFIPEYLGQILLSLPPEELDETIGQFEKLMNAGSERTAAAAAETVAVAAEHYASYTGDGDRQSREKRLKRLLGIIMKGCAYYRKGISRESMRSLGEHIFASTSLTPEDKSAIGHVVFKRLLSILPGSAAVDELDFYNDAAMLNRVYHFISEYRDIYGGPEKEEMRPAAFFPGTFDPFSLGHKAIATTIRDMGFDVYLAIDEFSWSKKTLPHMMRRNILAMSAADEEGLYIFPDNISVNIANPEDLTRLRQFFGDRKLYIAVGSDVVLNASAYKNEPSRDSIHSFNHIVFAREAKKLDADGDGFPIEGEVISLELKKYYEDISSTKIRENVDLGRDVSSLVDPVVQNYIYDMNLYVREPADKYVIQAKELYIHEYADGKHADISPAAADLESRGFDADVLRGYVENCECSVVIETGSGERRISAFAAAKMIETHELLCEFGDIEIASHIREHSGGGIAVIGAFNVFGTSGVSNLRQILLTELLTSLLARDFAYAVYHPVCSAGIRSNIIEAFTRQGFVDISNDPADPVYAVDMRNPITIFRDADTVIKAPLNKNPRVQRAFDNAHYNLLKTFREIYPGKLLLSFNTSAVYSKIVDLAAEENGVSVVPDPLRRRGPYIAVPFGKALSDVAVPNTVTKAMRTEKYFRNDLRSFDIRESRGYQTLDDQARTIKSFARPAILIDDLLHSGQRLGKIDPILRRHGVEVHKVIVGLLTGRALDQMRLAGRDVEGAYFIPSISMWLNERDCYPFIGGDSIDNPEDDSGAGQTTGQARAAFQAESSEAASAAGWCAIKRRPDAPAKEGNASVNLILPYTSAGFIGGGDPDKIYDYSITCLENAVDILHVLEQEYQRVFEKKLTVRRLGAVITNPRRPILGFGLQYDDHIAPSVYVENELRKTKRLFLFRNGQK